MLSLFSISLLPLHEENDTLGVKLLLQKFTASQSEIVFYSKTLTKEF